MANNMRTTLLQAGTAEGLPLEKKAHYIAPDITTVEFAVEIGLDASFHITSINNRTDFIDTESDGTEQYEAVQDRNFF